MVLFWQYAAPSQTVSAVSRVSLESACGNAALFDYYGINPAGLERIKDYAVFASYSPSRFGLSELSPAMLFAGYNAGKGIFASVSINALGNDLYNEQSISLASAYSADSIFSIGVSAEYARIGIRDYPANTALFVNIGGIVSIWENVIAGFAITNINRAAYKFGDRTPVQRAVFGIGAVLTRDLSADIDAIVSFNRGSGIAAAVKYKFDELIAVRLASSTEPTIIEAGVRFNALAGFDITASLSYCDNLGYSRSFGVAFR